MKNYKILLLTAIAAWLAAGQITAFAMKDDIDRPLPKGDDMKGDRPRLQEYDEIVSPDMESAWSLANRARGSLKNGNVSRALALATKAMKMDDDDIDIHLIYAQAMQAKYERQTEKDPDLFKKCVHEWMLVYRNEVGMEKGMTFKGVNIMGNFWNDDEHGNLAKKQIKIMTGYTPKPWETDNHFLARVTKPAETSVSAKLKNTSDEPAETTVRGKVNHTTDEPVEAAGGGKTKRVSVEQQKTD
jgi:hypothetical protein